MPSEEIFVPQCPGLAPEWPQLLFLINKRPGGGGEAIAPRRRAGPRAQKGEGPGVCGVGGRGRAPEAEGCITREGASEAAPEAVR